MATHTTNSLNIQTLIVEGPSDPNPGPLPESALKRLEELRELYRQRDAAIKANLSNSTASSEHESA